MARRAKDLGAGDGDELKGPRKSRMGKVAGEKQDAAPTVLDEGTKQHHHAMLSSSLRDIEEKTEELSSLRGVYQNARKAAKKVGIDVAAWKRAWDLKKREPTEVIAEHQHTIEWLKFMGAPLGTQMDMFSDVEVRNTVSAESAGYAAGKNGETATNNPHPPGTKEAQDWQAGWLRGQAKILGVKVPTGDASGGDDFVEDEKPGYVAAREAEDAEVERKAARRGRNGTHTEAATPA